MIKVGIIGSSKSICTKEIYDYAFDLGKYLAKKIDFTVICSGNKGVSEGFCKGVKSVKKNSANITIGLPSDSVDSEVGDGIDITICTGVGLARNLMIINSAEILISLSGGAGTLSEISFAWQQNKPVLCNTELDGWSKVLAGKNIDNRRQGLLIPFNSKEDALHKFWELTKK